VNDIHLTADICDEFDQQAIILAPIFANYGGITVFEGEIVTLKTFNDNSLVREILNEKGNGRVLVIDGAASMDCSLLGGNLALLASQNDWAGAVVNGCVRDLLELVSIDFGVKAIGANPKKSVKAGIGEKNVEVCVGGVKVFPGQYLFSDPDGTVIVPSSLVSKPQGTKK